jgi:transposase
MATGKTSRRSRLPRLLTVSTAATYSRICCVEHIDEFAQHYGAAGVPARAGRPRDKAIVEANVLVAQRWILAALRHRRVFSLAELKAPRSGSCCRPSTHGRCASSASRVARASSSLR